MTPPMRARFVQDIRAYFMKIHSAYVMKVLNRTTRPPGEVLLPLAKADIVRANREVAVAKAAALSLYFAF